MEPLNDTPYVGLNRDGRGAAARPHVIVSGPTGVGKTRRVLAPAAIRWNGPAVCVSSKSDLAHLVAERRSGPAWLLDLSGEVTPPEGVKPVRYDPTATLLDLSDLLDGGPSGAAEDRALTLASLLLRTGALGGGDGESDGSAFWQTLAAPPLAALLLAGALSTGIEYTLAAARRDMSEDENAPSWAHAASLLPESSPLADELESLMSLDQRVRDSITATMRSGLAPWQRHAVRGAKGVTAWDPEQLGDSGTLYVIAPATGVAAGAAVSALHELIELGRARTARGEVVAPVLLVLDELANCAPLPSLPTYVTEGRGLGVRILAAVQATEQLALRWGAQGRDVLRQTFPSALVMHGAPERDMLDAAAWWSGRHEVLTRSTSTQGGLQHGRETVELYTGSDLLPDDREHARLVLDGTPGVLVSIPDISAT